jgi:oxygen-independent coproporphyrinogen-3 oxidase
MRPSEPWGVYVHIPWCAIRCPYCAFAVDARAQRPERAYTDAVLQQWDSEREYFSDKPSSLYFGGGTPSQADPAEIARIIQAVAPAPDAEITAEVNPGKLDAGRLAELASVGVNRVSLGVQSFQPDVARRLGRAHSCKEADDVYALARTLGFRSISLDLIFGVPGQTLADFDADLDRIAACPPNHVSLYGLTIEPGTPFHRAGYGKKSSEAEEADDDLWRRMYDRATERLADVGIHVYEVSNFAAAGHRSRHNEHYWRARSWAGLGASAHGCRPAVASGPPRRGAWRTQTRSEVDAYIHDPSSIAEHVGEESLLAELIGSTLRHVDGVDLESVFERTGFRITVPEALLRQGTLSVENGVLKLHPRDLPVVDFVAARLCEARRRPITDSA